MAGGAPRIPALHLPWVLIFTLFLTFMFSSCNSSPLRKLPRLRIIPNRPINFRHHNTSGAAHPRFRTYYFNQTLDHFSYQPGSYATFRQRYMVSFKHWGGAFAASPIFVYLGSEESLDESVSSIGFLNENAERFGALVVYIEHRYYGKSIPSRPPDLQNVYNATSLGYLNSAQALADYAEIIQHLKRNLSTEASPVVVIGGSYGGMLAAWFRLKYPHIAVGALASSAPILYFDDITLSDGFHSVVTRNFREASEVCYHTIKQSWSEIDRMVVEQENGLDILTQKFQTCEPLEEGDEMQLKAYLELTYITASQYDDPPTYPVTQICSTIQSAVVGVNSTIDLIASAINIIRQENSNDNNNNRNKGQCLDLSRELRPSDDPLDTLNWLWQACTEIVMPIGHGENDTMFQADPFDMYQYSEMCNQLYHGARPRPHWITTYYGGHHIRRALERFGSNIIFSNGLHDPFSVAGILTSISPSVVAVTTPRGSHCLDLLPAKTNDPRWLVAQRNRELGIIARWLRNYYKDSRIYSFEK